MLPVLVALFLSQTNQSDALTLAGSTKLRYPPIMLAARVQGTIDLEITLIQGAITSIKAVQPDPKSARPILRESAEELVRSLNYWGKATGTLRVRIIYRLSSPTQSHTTNIAINPFTNEITITANQLIAD